MAKRTGALPKLLEIIGKPIYWLLYGLLLLISYLLNLLPKIRLPIIKLPKFKLPKIRLKKRKKVYQIYPRVNRKWLIILIVILVVLSVCLSTSWFIFKTLPDPNQLITHQPILTTKIFDRNGELLYKIYRQENRTLVDLKDIPQTLIKATIAIEDAEFYSHHGFSIKGIVRAIVKDVKGDRLYGGSTITQQLVKNTLLSPEKTLLRKIREIILALMVETKFSKDQILQMYLNEVGFGGAAYGVEEAAQAYFGKSVKDLNLAEAALLAGLPASPTQYSPFGTHPEKAKERQALVLQRMLQEKFITNEEKILAENEELHFSQMKNEIKAPHFVMFIKEMLVQQFGEQFVEQGGLQVTTSLDINLQNRAQNIIREEIEKLKSLKIGNGAALVTNPATGEILAMVGSQNYFDLANDGNVNVTTRSRQPGSSIKPVMYSLALESGFTPATIISDTPITYQVAGQPPYSPKNYDSRFHGNVTLRRALASSYNVPAVKVLSALGVDKMIKRGTDMGITTWDDPSRFGLSLTLGGGEVKMVDLAVAYGTFVNQGRRVDLNPILEIKNFLLTDILSDNNARTPAFGPRSWLNITGHPHVAVKTGTTQNLRDNWTIGYTADYLTAVWVGNNNNSPMSYVASGVTGASPIWNKIMTYLLKDTPDKEFPIPEGIIRTKVCGKEEYFITGTESKVTCPVLPTPTLP
jgi:penicillin-binding protein 1C